MGPPLPVTEAGNEDTTRADIDGPGALPKQVLMQITATSQDEHAVKGKVLLISSSLFHQNSAFMYDEYTRNHQRRRDLMLKKDLENKVTD